jgi:putative flippase GtrA
VRNKGSLAATHYLHSLGRFAAVGVAGFLIDATVLNAMLALGVGFYRGRAISFLAAATVTWYANRHLTFSSRDPRFVSEWARFLAANASGGIVNYTVYAALIYHSALCQKHPTLGVAAGSIAGLLLNFTVSKNIVFRARGR